MGVDWEWNRYQVKEFKSPRVEEFKSEKRKTTLRRRGCGGTRGRNEV
jgi:hypothetical protein